VLRPRHREQHALGDVVGRQRLDVGVDGAGLLLVAAEAHAREVRLDQARVDSGDVDRAAEQILAQRIGEAAHRELGGHVHGRVLVRLPAGDRAEVDDVPTVAQMRQAEAGHAHQPVHVGLEHDLFVLFSARVERLAAEAEPRVVDKDVEPAELPHGLLDEALAAGRVGHVELKRDLRLECIRAPGAAGHPCACLGQRTRNRGADPARGAGDDRGLALEPRHECGAYLARGNVPSRAGAGACST
jgi:hypothetical protein